MKRVLSVLVILLLPTIPSALFAKAQTSKIIIKGADLSTPIEITNAKTLANFYVWTGAGTSCTPVPACSTPSTQSFIVDWSQPIADHPSGLHRYEVSFYAKMPDERLIYVVFYECDPATGPGYVYFPGRNEEWYRLNVSTISHGVEGEWFRAWSVWDDVARPLIAGAEAHVAQRGSSVKDDFALLIAEAQATPAAKLDSTLPQASLQEWISQQIGADATVAWVVRTGKGYDLPWVEADISIGHRPAVVIMIACGRHNWVTRSRPRFMSLLLFRQGEFEEWPHLHDLPVAMRQAREQS